MVQRHRLSNVVQHIHNDLPPPTNLASNSFPIIKVHSAHLLKKIAPTPKTNKKHRTPIILTLIFILLTSVDNLNRYNIWWGHSAHDDCSIPMLFSTVLLPEIHLHQIPQNSIALQLNLEQPSDLHLKNHSNQ